MISIIVISDYKLFRESLLLVLESVGSFKVFSATSHIHKVIQKVYDCQPDIVLLDVNLPDKKALVLTSQIAQEFPSVKSLMLGIDETESEIGGCVEAGASGYVTRDASLDELLHAIELVARGETLCSPQIAHGMFSHLSKLVRIAGGDRVTEPNILSLRETEILQLIAEGMSNKQIAEHLFLSLYTVKNHVHNILKKLQVKHRLEAVHYASQRGLVQLQLRRQ
jgi:two-component system nitrate/nitrite response regulator NarL